MSRQPWMKFFPADWQSDHLLRSCSISARGLWIELLCIMQKADPIGHLLVNGKAPTPKLLGTLCGVSEREIKGLLGELEAAGVFDMADGVIVSRRMVRDAEKAARDKANGRMGGNPRVKAGVNPPDNPEDKGEDKAHIPEARSQNTLGASAPGKPAPPDRFEEFWEAYPEREGADPKKPAHLAYARAIKRGADPDQIIAAALQLANLHPKPTRFVPRATTWLNDERYNDAPGLALVPAPADDDRWQKRLRFARTSREWSLRDWGPMPGAAGCLVPPHLLQASDGEGWAAQREAA